MFDIRQYEPLWGKWYLESLLGKGSFGQVYRVRREEFGKTWYCAVKIVSIPQDDDELRQLISEGLEEASLQGFLHACVTDILTEIDVMNRLSGNSHIVSYQDHEIIERTGSIGWDILIRMELLTNLGDYAARHPLSTAETIRMGIHICRALELCAQKNIIHRDIKPANIFISPNGDYKLGDFGIARHISQTMTGLSQKGTHTYMAPEVFRNEPYGAGADIYSLGMVMYRYLNHNRIPFLPETGSVMPRHRELALQRRLSGEAMPPIQGLDPGLNALVLKACAYDPRERFESPTHMREALEIEKTTKRTAFGNAPTGLLRINSDNHTVPDSPPAPGNYADNHSATHTQSNKKHRRHMVVICFCAALLLGLASGAWFISSSWNPRQSLNPSSTTDDPTELSVWPTLFTITYDYGENGGVNETTGEPITTAQKAAGEAVELPFNAVKQGWDFVGWNTDKSAQGRLDSFTIPVSSDERGVIWDPTPVMEDSFEKKIVDTLIWGNTDALLINAGKITLPAGVFTWIKNSPMANYVIEFELAQPRVNNDAWVMIQFYTPDSLRPWDYKQATQAVMFRANLSANDIRYTVDYTVDGGKLTEKVLAGGPISNDQTIQIRLEVLNGEIAVMTKGLQEGNYTSWGRTLMGTSNSTHVAFSTWNVAVELDNVRLYQEFQGVTLYAIYTKP